MRVLVLEDSEGRDSTVNNQEVETGKPTRKMETDMSGRSMRAVNQTLQGSKH